MKRITLPTGEYLLETIPSDAYDFKLSRDNPDDPTYISYLRKSTGNYRDGYDLDLLQPQHYEIIGRASELSEEQWKEIAMNDHGDLFDYTNKNMFCATASESGISLIKSHSKNPETTLVIRKIK